MGTRCGNSVAKTLQAIDFEAGKDFNIVVVSFDATDTVEIAADKKKSVVHAFNRNGDLIHPDATLATLMARFLAGWLRERAWAIG